MFWPARYNWPMVSTFTVLERKTINDKKGRCDAHELAKVAARGPRLCDRAPHDIDGLRTLAALIAWKHIHENG